MVMFSRCSRVMFSAAVVGMLSPAHANTTPATLIVWAGTLLAVPGKPAATGQSIVIRRGRIERVSGGKLDASAVGSDPAGTRIVDLSCCFVLPGLFDLHVHLTTEPDPATLNDDVTLTSADLALRAAGNAATTLQAGFTTVLDMGTGRRAHELAIYAVRDAINAGKLVGPRILA